MTKKTKTPEEIAEALRIKEFNKKFNKLISKVKASCKSAGVAATEYQYEFIKNNVTILPNDELTRDENIEAFKLGIERYKEDLVYGK